MSSKCRQSVCSNRATFHVFSYSIDEDVPIAKVLGMPFGDLVLRARKDSPQTAVKAELSGTQSKIWPVCLKTA